MGTNSDDRRDAAALLRDAVLFNLLAKCFSYPRPPHHAIVADTFRRLCSTATSDAAIKAAFTAASDAWQAANVDDAQAAYVRWFASDGRCSLHETAYGDGRRIAGRAVELADVQGFYRAFEFGLTEHNPDLPDHLCAELEFYSLLLVKRAYAQSAGWGDQAEITHDAARSFLQDHLGRWIPALAQAIADATVPQPYVALAALLDAVTAREVRRLRVSPQVAAGRVTSDAMQADNLICPLANERP